MDDGTLSVADGWVEAAFERGTYGSDDVPGFEARLESGDLTIEVLPVVYQRDGTVESARSLVNNVEATRDDPTKPELFVDRRVAFGIHLRYPRGEGVATNFFSFVARAPDALAVACWLSKHTDDRADLKQHIAVHAGTAVAAGPSDPLADDPALDAFLADEQAVCLYSGNPTRSHAVRFPFRYVPSIPDFPVTKHGMVRVPNTVVELRAAVSHSEWTDRDLSESNFEGEFERVESGVYELGSTVPEALADASADSVVLVRFEDE